MFVYVPPSPPSPEAVALGHRIAEAVRLLRAENPDIGPRDVRAGLRLAEAELRPELGGADPHKVSLVVGGMALALGIGVFFAIRGGIPVRDPILWTIVGLGVVAALFAALKAR